MDWIEFPLDKSQKEELEKYYVPRAEFERNNTKIYNELDKRVNENRDRIEEVDDKFTDRWHETQRVLDRQSQNMETLDTSVNNLNDSIVSFSNTLQSNMENVKDIESRVERTETSLSDKELAKQQRKVETVKFLTALVTGLLGAGGLLSWLGPLIFGGK